MPGPSPCPNSVDHVVEWDRTIIDRCFCPSCNLSYPFDPPPVGERTPYKDDD